MAIDFTPDTTRPPISVKATAAPVVMSESTKVVLVAVFAFAASQFIKSDAVIAAVMAASGIVATWVWGVWHRIRTWGALRFLAMQVPDHVATVGK